MIILLFASRRFSLVHEKFALNSLNFRWCFVFFFCSVVHSQQHCIVRVIKLLNKFQLSLRCYRFEGENESYADENLFRHSTKSIFNTRFFSTFYCHLANFISPRRESERASYTGKLFPLNKNSSSRIVIQKTSRFMSRNFRCNTL
jgi:hypothetical protein